VSGNGRPPMSTPKKLGICAALLGLVLLISFWAGPGLIRLGFYMATPAAEIAKWTAEFSVLDASRADERRRLELVHMLGRRGAQCDAGLRDESVKHNPGLYNAAVMKKWEWEDLFR